MIVIMAVNILPLRMRPRDVVIIMNESGQLLMLTLATVTGSQHDFNREI